MTISRIERCRRVSMILLSNLVCLAEPAVRGAFLLPSPFVADLSRCSSRIQIVSLAAPARLPYASPPVSMDYRSPESSFHARGIGTRGTLGFGGRTVEAAHRQAISNSVARRSANGLCAARSLPRRFCAHQGPACALRVVTRNRSKGRCQ
ncbi:hypothetical protein C8R46DRAFT_90775 [Mycena filopes]|nr:hypothetical protein C8R46DRAFT_90775 [Mycena filopes]